MKSLYPALLSLTLTCYAQEVKPKDPVNGINEAFEKHQVVMLMDIHFNRQEHEFLLNLISSPKFSKLVSDIVLEGANARYQQQVDRYVAGNDIPIDQLRQVWRDGLGLGAVPDRPEEELFAACVT